MHASKAFPLLLGLPRAYPVGYATRAVRNPRLLYTDLDEKFACTHHDGADPEAAELQISWPAGSRQEPGVENFPQEAWLNTMPLLRLGPKRSGISVATCSHVGLLT